MNERELATQIGVALLCICTAAPLFSGLLLGAWLQRRIYRLGWPWGLLPAKAQDIYQTVKDYIRALEQEVEKDK